MKYTFAVALSTLVLGIAAAPAAANGNGNAIAHAERGYFEFLHHAARAEKPSKTRSAKGPKKTKASRTRRPGSIITSAPGAPGNGTDSFGIRAGNGTAPPPVAGGGGLPASSGTSILKAAQTVAAGEAFDGGMVAFDRGVSCTGQAEGGDSDAVFILEKGAKLSNVIIGPNQIEGVHCNGGCALDNVWWSAVCEDAFTIKLQDAGETTTISGGGAFGADDKVLQHNGAGTLSVTGFTVETFGKLYRSCGNCKTSAERHVIFDGVNASSGKLLAGINPNFGDTATFKNVVAKDVKEICTEFKGTTPGNEPSEVSSGPSSACIYSTSDVTIS